MPDPHASLLKPGESFAGPDPHAALLKPGESFADESPSDPGVPNMPSDVRESLITAAGHVLPRAGAMTAGAEGGALVGSLAGPVGTAVGAAVGGGLGNVAGKYFPEEIGGDPSESNVNQFLLGSIPEAAGRGIAGALEKWAMSKAAEAAHEDLIKALDRGANPMPGAEAATTAEAIGRQSLARPPVLTGPALTDATNDLRKTILAPINEARRTLGEPIGAAYEALKGDERALTAPQMQELSDAARTVQDGMLSPYPKAKALLNRLKNYVPPAAEPSSVGELGGLPAGETEDIGGDIVQRGKIAPTAESLRLQGVTENQIKTILGQAEAAKPLTLDELREIRQSNNATLRGAQGGDIHAGLGLQQAIDQQLMPYLPAGISRDRELYRGFMTQFPWREINKVNETSTPQQLVDYALGGTDEHAHAIIDGLSDEGKKALGQGLIDKALRANNPDLPLDQQSKIVRGVLTPYVANGVATRLFGDDAANVMREAFYAPEHMAQMSKILQQPDVHDTFVKSVADYMKSDKTRDAAIENGFQKVVNSLPEADRARFQTAPVPGANMPVLMGTQEALEAGLTPGESRLPAAMARRLQMSGGYALGRAGMGSPGYAAANVLGMAGVATTAAGYRAIMENGGAGALAHLYASPTKAAAARATIEMLAAIGAQSANEATREPSK